MPWLITPQPHSVNPVPSIPTPILSPPIESQLICPITQSPIVHPVRLDCGHILEEDAIIKHGLSTFGSLGCPLDRKPMTIGGKTLVENSSDTVNSNTSTSPNVVQARVGTSTTSTTSTTTTTTTSSMDEDDFISSAVTQELNRETRALDSNDAPNTVFDATASIIEGERVARSQPEDNRTGNFNRSDRVIRTGELRKAELDLMAKLAGTLEAAVKAMVDSNEKTNLRQREIIDFLKSTQE